MNSLITLRWKYGGRNVSSATIHRGGKITKSTLGHARRIRRRGEHGEDGWIRMVEAHAVDHVEAREVVLAGRVVAMPRDHVERRVIQPRAPRLPAEACENLGGTR